MTHSKTILVALATVALAACQTTERAADATADAAGDAAGAVADVAEGAADVAVDVANATAGAVSDAAGAVYNTAEDVFTDDPDVDAVALVRPTSAPGARAQGTVRFMDDDGDLVVMASLSGLAPGRHGFHVHQVPSCEMGDPDGDGQMEPGGAAGAHWDPLGTGNHGAATDDLDSKHLGDLGNVTADASGNAEATFTVADFPSDQSVAGHAIIVHAQADDTETDPGGTAGARVGCGVIEGRM